MGLGTNHVTTTTAGPLAPANLYAKTYLESVRKNKPALAFFKDWSAFYAGEGKGQAINVPKPAAFTKNNKTVGSEVTLNNATTTSATITLNQHYEVSFIIEDAVANQGRAALMEQAYIEEAIDAKMNAVDAYLLALASSFTTTVAATTNTGDNLYANFLTARKTLNSSAVPMDNRGWFLGADCESRCLNMTQFISSLYRGSSPVQTGATNGALFLGAEVFLAQNVASATVSSTTTDTNFIAHKTAIGYVVAIEEFKKTYVPQYLGWLYTTHILFGASVMDAARGVKLTTTY